MASRLKLHDELVDVLGSNNCYYQPPESFKMKYPCIRYNLDRIDCKRADNINYNKANYYTITYIHKDADTDLTEKILDRFQMCRHDRRYTADNLYHDVFVIYY